MSDTMVTELPEALSVEEDDLLYLVQNDTSKKIPKSTFKNEIKSDELLDIRTGANGLSYTNAGNAVREQVNSLKNINNLISIDISLGWYTSQDVLIQDNNFKHTELLPCKPSTTLTVYGALTDNQYAAAILFYNNNGTKISEAGKNVGGSSLTVTIPDNARYFRLNAKVGNTIAINYDWCNYAKVVSNIIKKDNLSIYTHLKRGWTDKYNVAHDSDSGFERVIVKLDKSSNLYFNKAETNNQYFYYLLFADQNGTFLTEGRRTQTGNTEDTITTSDYPEEAVYAQITYKRGVSESATITNGNLLQIVPCNTLDLLKEVNGGHGTAEVIIPDTITAIVGDTLQIYYDSIIKSTVQVEVEVTGTKGKAYPRYYEYIPTVNDIGTSNLTINVRVYENINSSFSEVIATKTISLKTIAKPSSPASEKHILCVGDSTIVGGVYVKELARKICATNGDHLSNIKFTGRLEKNVESGLDVGYEGFSGWSWNNYVSSASKAIRFYVTGVSSLNFEAVYEDANGCKYNISEINVTVGDGNIRCLYTMGSQTTTPPTSGTLTRISGSGDSTITYTNIAVEEYSPFYVNGQVDFETYVNEYCNGTVDYVLFSLGTNSIVNYSGEFSDLKSQILAQMGTLISKLHSQYPNAKVLICTLQKGSMRGGFGYNFGVNNANSYYYNRKVYELNKAYIEFAAAHSSYVSIVNLSGEFDTLYNYPHTMKNVNTRDSEDKEMIDSNFGHPSVQGYYQMADAMYRTVYRLLGV